jgi:hypothetical protein
VTDDLREQIARSLHRFESGGEWDGCPTCLARADALLTGALAALLADLERLTAERDNARAGLAALARVRTLADTWQGRAGHWQSWTPAGPAAHYGATLRKAIDGTP